MDIKNSIMTGLGLTTANPSEETCTCGITGGHRATCKYAKARTWEQSLLNPGEMSEVDKEVLIRSIYERHPEAKAFKTPEEAKILLKKAVLSDMEMVATWQRFSGRSLHNLQGIVIGAWADVERAKPKTTYSKKYVAADGSTQIFTLAAENEATFLMAYGTEVANQRAIAKTQKLRQAEFDSK